MYVLLNVPCADRLVRLHSTRSEVVGSVRELRHELAREALMRHGIGDNVEVSSLADVPAGTGLGSSSSYLVGLLLAIRTHLGLPASPSALAEEACAIEIEALRKPIGKQDQYLAAFGDLTELHIARDGTVRVERIALPAEVLGEFSSACHLYFTNVTRSAADMLVIGMAVSSLSGLAIAYLILEYLFTGIHVDGWTSVITSVRFFGGLTTLVLGILGIYIANILAETKRGPCTVVRKIYEGIDRPQS